MSQAISTVAVCLVLIVGVVACSLESTERNRLRHALQLACFEGGGNWNSLSFSCDRPEAEK